MLELTLHTLPAIARRRRRRVGRGNASRRGTYSGRGQKGQRARTGGRKGLQQRSLKALYQRLPKLGGFRSLKAKAEVITIGQLNQHFASGATVTPKALAKKGLVASEHSRVKVLNTGSLSKALTIKGCQVSSGAREKIMAAGGGLSEE